MATIYSKSAREYQNRLTQRETQVLYLLCDRAEDKQIAYAFAISEETIHQHLSNMRRKFQVHNRTALASFALRNNVIESDPSVRPSVVEVELDDAQKVANIIFRYLTALTRQQMSDTARDLLDKSFADYIGKDWREKIKPYLKAIETARKSGEECEMGGSRPSSTGSGGGLSLARKDFSYQ